MKRIETLFRRVPQFVSLCTGCVLIMILLIQLLGQNALSSVYQNQSLLSNLLLFPAALLLIAVLWFLRGRLAVCPRPWLTRVLFLVTLLVQFLVARTCWYHLGWDPGTVHTTAEEIARGLPVSDHEYFISCPNNAPLTALLAIPLWAAVKINLGVPYVVLPYIDAVILNVTAYVCVHCVYQLTRSSTARLLSVVLAIGWIALSPYIIYPYTDVFSIFFPMMALYLYLRMHKTVLKWLLVSLLCFFGAAIKPTVLIFLIALVLLSLCRLMAEHGFAQPAVRKRILLVCLAIILGAIPGKVFENMSIDWLTDGHANDTHLSVTHYLMLGMNSDTYGGHSVADVELTMSYETLTEAQTANLRRAWERVSERSLIDNAKFFAVKAYKAYADGSFASHGSFLEMDVPKRTDMLSMFLRRLYHKDGDLMPYCQTIVQCIWLGILILCAVAAFRSRHSPAIALLSLTLLGLTAYLLLFEVWPRYLFLYAPFFVVLASLAFDKPDMPVVK